MTKKTKPKNDPKALVVKVDKPEKEQGAIAKMLLKPTVQAAFTAQDVIGRVSPNEDLDLMALIDELNEQSQKVHNGSLDRLEATLTAQAHTLDLIFNKLTQKALKAEYMKQLEGYLKLGLKAQSQCRSTLETLAAIKNPQPVAFVKQANIAQNQQINNGESEAIASRAGKNEIAPNELLEAQPQNLGSGYLHSPNSKMKEVSPLPNHPVE